MASHLSELDPPPLGLFVREAGALLALRWRSVAPPRIERPNIGRGRPVMVIPGFLAGDHSTRVLRQALGDSGFRAYGWGLGWNLGARSDILDRLEAQLDGAAKKGPVTLIGWSLGGLYAREVAKRCPRKVAQVVTLGSPFSGHARANNAWRLYEMLNDHKVDCPPLEVRTHEKPPVPTIACWSRRDGIVAPASARGQPHECDRAVELDCTHMGFMSEPAAMRAILDLLAD